MIDNYSKYLQGFYDDQELNQKTKRQVEKAGENVKVTVTMPKENCVCSKRRHKHERHKHEHHHDERSQKHHDERSQKQHDDRCQKQRDIIESTKKLLYEVTALHDEDHV